MQAGRALEADLLGIIQTDVEQQGHTPMAGWANKFTSFAAGRRSHKIKNRCCVGAP